MPMRLKLLARWPLHQSNMLLLEFVQRHDFQTSVALQPGRIAGIDSDRVEIVFIKLMKLYK
jgi:hypothetical protein